MRIRTPLLATGSALVLVTALFDTAGRASGSDGATVPGTTIRVSVPLDGSWDREDSAHSAVSDDGRYVAFTSTSDHLTTAEGDFLTDVFVRDTWSATTDVMSLRTDGTGFRTDAYLLSMSGDASRVYFRTPETRYAEVFRVWVRDCEAGTTTRLAERVVDAAVSSNGRWFAYGAWTDDTQDSIDLHLRDLATDAELVVGSVPTDWSLAPSVADSGDIAFHTPSSLTPEDGDATYDVYVWTRQTETYTLVPHGPDGLHRRNAGMPVITPDSGAIVFWADGAWILWEAPSTWSWIDEALPNEFTPLGAALTPDASFVVYVKGEADEHGSTYVYLYDRAADTTARVDVNEYGVGSMDSRPAYPSITPDGRFVAFMSDTSSLVPGGRPNYYQHVYLRDREGSPVPGPLPDLMVHTSEQPFWTGEGSIGVRVDSAWDAIRANGRTTIELRVVNLAPFEGAIGLEAPPSTRRVRLRYVVDHVDVTEDVTAGTYVTPLLPADGAHTVVLRVRVVPRDASVYRHLTIRTWSTVVPAWRDVMMLTISG